MINNIVAIIPAAGKSQRMNLSIPKQYIKVNQKTILEHTINKFLALPAVKQIVVVISQHDHYFSTLPIANHPKIITTFGGETRAESVLAGLQLLNDNDWALVHDAARPLIEHKDIQKLIKQVLTAQTGGILATKITDTIKKSQTAHQQNNVIECTYDRTHLWAAATPQMFKSEQLKQSLLTAINHGVEVTDEASAIEYNGGNPLLIECGRCNIKLTRTEDLPLIEFYLNSQKE